MSFDKHWEELCKKTPELNDPEIKMTITVASLKVRLLKTWNASLASVKSTIDLADQLKDLGSGKGKDNPFGNFDFDNILGQLGKGKK